MNNDILEQNPFDHTTNHGERIVFLANAVAEGVKRDLWSPLLRVRGKDVGGDESEIWDSQGHFNYRDRLNKYLHEKWNDMYPRASFLESFGYLQRVSPPRTWQDDANSRPVDYILTPKATALTESAPSDVRVFISYRRQVSSIQALMLSYWLTSQGIENFLDIEGISPGDLHPQIEEAINSRTHLICILGTQGKESTIDSEYVRKEIELAKKLDKECIPFFQHDWIKPSDKSIQEYSSQVKNFINSPGQPVAELTEEKAGGLANAYRDTLNRLLPFLNKSQLT